MDYILVRNIEHGDKAGVEGQVLKNSFSQGRIEVRHVFNLNKSLFYINNEIAKQFGFKLFLCFTISYIFTVTFKKFL